ncbi:MAG: hypothetical protein QGG74_01210, partial [Phycisphaerales bacterium]|nr:hypothetical protein [Phycisphaerales bacterium]
SENGWHGWFEVSGGGDAAGSMLEGWLDVAALPSGVPESVAIAAVSYGTEDGDILAACCQAPDSLDGDGDVQDAEFVVVSLCDLHIAECCTEDVNGDGFVGVDDVLAILGSWGQVDGIGDVNEDGIVGVDDLLAVLASWGGC